MKAAHRKELEKNVLADRLGRLATNVRKPPQRGTWMTILGVVVVLAAFFAIMRVRTIAREDASRNWVMFDDGYREYIDNLKDKFSDDNVGKAARFEYAWMMTWDFGVKKLAADPIRALTTLDTADGQYAELAEKCKNDPIWEAEALYARAVIEEARAVKDRKHLDKAREMYLEVTKKHPEAVHGKLAKTRAEELKPKTASRDRVDQFYQDLEESLPQLRLPPNHPPLFPKAR